MSKKMNPGRNPSYRRSALLSLTLLLGAACGCASASKEKKPDLPTSNFKSVVAIAAVVDQPAAVLWCPADLTPSEGVAEWELAPNAWLQVAVDPVHAGKGSIAVVVHDLEAQQKTCSSTGTPLGEVQDFGVVKILEATDPEGNALVFVEEVAPPTP